MSTYKALKREFQQNESAFARKYSDHAARVDAIRLIARAKNDNGWPLGMLRVLVPELAFALKHWTAGGYETIRNAQEGGCVIAGSPADKLLKNFPELPLWRGRATHVSKSPELFDMIRNERKLTLGSFMGCCAPLHTFAYVSRPNATLRFTKLATGYLVAVIESICIREMQQHVDAAAEVVVDRTIRIDHRGPIPPGSPLRLRGWLERLGERSATFRVQAHDAHEIVCEATVTLVAAQRTHLESRIATKVLALQCPGTYR